MKAIGLLSLALLTLTTAVFATEPPRPVPYDSGSLELLNVVALCPTEYAELRSAGWLRAASRTQDFTSDGKRVLTYQLTAAIGGFWNGPPSRVTGTLVITRTALARPGEIMDAPTPYETTCHFTKLP